ncbi:O-antigen ligase family protein [Tenacibaculum sp.]|uniref:O-antigen ligase family protein n=1 Tax=Tenacibaculum sp. TaxID=1906242 RepID=UPI003D0BA707
MKFVTFLAGLIAALPFVIAVEPFYSGYISFLLLIFVSDLKKINLKRLSYYLFYVFTVCISLVNVDYYFEIKELLIGLLIPIVFLFFDLKIDYDSFFKGVNVGIVIVTLSLLYLSVEKNLIGNYMTFFTSERDWGNDSLFYGNGTALVLTLISSYYLIKDQILKSIIINIGAILTTSRVPLIMFAFIFIYILLISNVKKIYKALLTFILMGLIIYAAIFILKEESLINRFTRTGDRQYIFDYSFELFKKNIYLGFGPKDIPIYHHLHNSFFEVLFRYGIITFIFYLILLLKGNLVNTRLIFIFLTVFFFTFTQINLHNINYVVILSVIISNFKNLQNDDSLKCIAT